MSLLVVTGLAGVAWPLWLCTLRSALTTITTTGCLLHARWFHETIVLCPGVHLKNLAATAILPHGSYLLFLWCRVLSLTTLATMRCWSILSSEFFMSCAGFMFSFQDVHKLFRYFSLWCSFALFFSILPVITKFSRYAFSGRPRKANCCWPILFIRLHRTPCLLWCFVVTFWANC